MARRTFGWVQNPGNLDTLRNVVSSLVHGTNEERELYERRLPLIKANSWISESDYKNLLAARKLDSYPYSLLKGRGCGKKKRSEALCSGLVQAMLDAQKPRDLVALDGRKYQGKKPYQDDWSASGYISWAVALDFLEYNRETDEISVSKTGLNLAATEIDSAEETLILGTALLSYPPVIRVLSILNSEPERVFTKFEIGSKLGFKGEKGFTSIPQEVFVATLSEAPASSRKTVRQNLEGDSDKYARMIAGWLEKLGWVAKRSTIVNETYLGQTYQSKLQGFVITLAGQNALKRAGGYSRHPRIPKRVPYEMLGTKASSVEILRKRRALIIESLSKGSKTSAKIVDYLKRKGVSTTVAVVDDEIEGLKNIGLSINNEGDEYVLLDKIVGLDIPNAPVETSDAVLELKDKIRNNLQYVNHNYLILVDLAYSDAGKGSSDAREFEIETASLFVNELGFAGKHLGGPDRPDVIAFYDDCGLIIDNKSYSEGFSADKHNTDAMGRYIDQNRFRKPNIPPNEWWKNYDETVKTFSYLFVTSYLRGGFEVRLKELSELHDTHGGAISVENLLYAADLIKGGAMSRSEFCQATCVDGEVAA